MNQKSKSYLTKTIVFGCLMVASFVLLGCLKMIIRAIFLSKDAPKDFFELSSEGLSDLSDLAQLLGISSTKIKVAW